MTLYMVSIYNQNLFSLLLLSICSGHYYFSVLCSSIGYVFQEVRVTKNVVLLWEYLGF
jgi:hypothetical protein